MRAELDRRAAEIAVHLAELVLEAFEEGERVRAGAGDGHHLCDAVLAQHDRHPVGDDDYLETLREGDQIRIGRWKAPFDVVRRYLVTGAVEAGRRRTFEHNNIVTAMTQIRKWGADAEIFGDQAEWKASREAVAALPDVLRETLILRELLFGARRFNEIRRGMPMISRTLLGQRLRELEAEGVVIRRVSTGPPVEVAYELSSKGRDLEHVIDGVERWAHEWLGGSSPHHTYERAHP